MTGLRGLPTRTPSFRIVSVLLFFYINSLVFWTVNGTRAEMSRRKDTGTRPEMSYRASLRKILQVQVAQVPLCVLRGAEVNRNELD